MSWTRLATRSLLLQAGLCLALIAFCGALALIRSAGPRASGGAGYGFAYTGSGLQLGAQIWSALEAPPFWLLKARGYERSGKLADADQAWRAAINASGPDTTIGLDYAQFLERHGRAEDAAVFLAALHDRKPGDLAILERLARIELGLRHWDQADTVAAAIRKLDPSGPASDQLAAAALMGRGEFDKAVEAYRALAQRFPSAASTTALATALATAHKTTEAASILKEQIDRTPDNAQALVLLGWIQVADGHADKARDNFKLAVERQPTSNSGYLALARLDTIEHRVDDAIAVLRKGRRAVPGDWMLQFELALGLQAAKHYDEAIDEYEDMLRGNPDSLIAANNLAILLADHRSDAASLERATAVAAMLGGSNLPEFIDTRGWISYRRGEYEAAMALLKRAAADAPERAAIRYHLGMAYLARRDNEKAAAELKAAAALKPEPELAAKIDKALTAPQR